MVHATPFSVFLAAYRFSGLGFVTGTNPLCLEALPVCLSSGPAGIEA